MKSFGAQKREMFAETKSRAKKWQMQKQLFPQGMTEVVKGRDKAQSSHQPLSCPYCMIILPPFCLFHMFPIPDLADHFF